MISKSVEEGQTVAASFNTPELFTIAKDLTNMQVVANVDEADIGGVKEGEGPMHEWFDQCLEDDTYGEKTWEKAESKMLKTALSAQISPYTR